MTAFSCAATLAKLPETQPSITGPRPHLARTLDEATEALDFVRPLQSGDPRWRNLNPARGGDVARIIERYLTRAVPGRFQHVVFASHRGAGKSTELLRLAHDLRERFFCLYLEANVEMDANTIEMEDLLLVLARKVEAELRELGSPLPAEVLDRVNHWFRETLKTTSVGKDYVAHVETEVKSGLEIPFFASLLAKVTALFKVESTHRTEVKEVLRQYRGTLMDAVNQLLEAANTALEKHGQELLVIIDNLDRYHPKVIDELLVRGGDRFRELKTNLILTPPINLVYRPETGVLGDYFHVEVMPSVRLRGPQDPHDALIGEGPKLLLEALGYRIDLDRLIPDLATRDRLVVASGGSIRELLEVASDATLLADGEILQPEDVERAIKRRRDRMRDKINANGWLEALVDIAREHQIKSDDAYLSLLHHRLAFKYNEEGWYAHPLAYEIPEFHKAMIARAGEDAHATPTSPWVQKADELLATASAV